MRKLFLTTVTVFVITLAQAQVSMIPVIDEDQTFEVSVINYRDLNCVQKFKKIEFGIDLEGELEDRIKDYLANPYPPYEPNTNQINPFLEWSLDIEAIFTHVESGTVKKRDFFYYHDYRQVANDWDDAINDNNQNLMRVRFAPPLEGRWDVGITIKVNGELTNELPAFDFNVCGNDHPGYVTVHDNRRNFERGDNIVFPIGHVFPGPYNRVTGGKTPWGGDPSAPEKNTTLADWKAYYGDIESYVHQGGKSIKLIQTVYGNMLEFESLGNYYPRMHLAWEQDKIMDLCEENDVLINFNLFFQDLVQSYGQSGRGLANPECGGYDPVLWDYGNYGPDGLPNACDNFMTYCYFIPGTKPSSMFLEEERMKFHKQRTRYYVARYGYSPQIYTWELMSEPLHMDGHISASIEVNNKMIFDSPAQFPEHPGHEVALKAVDEYHSQISDYIKNELEDHDHLIAMDVAPRSELLSNSGLNFDIPCMSSTNIDILGYNIYSERTDKMIISKEGNNNGKKNLDTAAYDENSQYTQVTYLFNQYNKPIILSEVGHGWDRNCLGTTGNIIDAMTYGFCGIAGMHPWSGYSYGHDNEFHEPLLWPSTIASERHMNSEKVIPVLNELNGNWIQGRQVHKIYGSNQEDVKELQYYLSETRELATGYVRNRSYNSWTMRLRNSCDEEKPSRWSFNSPLDNFYPITWDQGPKRLYVFGLQKKEMYEIKWYDFISGELILTELQETDRKQRMKLKFPGLTLENPLRPILWFSMEKQKQ